MTDYFTYPKGGFTCHVSEEDYTIGLRFAIARHGEDPERVLQVFWDENTEADYEVAIIFTYGGAPRPYLSTKQSLSEALKTAKISPDSRQAQMWEIACRQHGVDWPSKQIEPHKPKARAEMQA